MSAHYVHCPTCLNRTALSEEFIQEAMRLADERCGRVEAKLSDNNERAALEAYLTQLLDDTVKDAIACTLEAQLLQPTEPVAMPKLWPPCWGDVLHFLRKHEAYDLMRIVQEGIDGIAVLESKTYPPVRPTEPDREKLLGDAIRALIRGAIACSDDLPNEKRPRSISARRAFGAVYDLLRAHPPLQPTMPVWDGNPDTAAEQAAEASLPAPTIDSQGFKQGKGLPYRAEWNDAIEAAAKLSQGHYIPGHSVAGPAFAVVGADAIRGLKRELPLQPTVAFEDWAASARREYAASPQVQPTEQWIQEAMRLADEFYWTRKSDQAGFTKNRTALEAHLRGKG